MREAALRTAAERHAAAVLVGDIDTVLADLDPSLHSQVAAMAAAMPEGLLRAEVMDLTSVGDHGRTSTRYSAAVGGIVVQATWEWRTDRFVVTSAGTQL